MRAWKFSKMSVILALTLVWRNSLSNLFTMQAVIIDINNNFLLIVLCCWALEFFKALLLSPSSNTWLFLASSLLLQFLTPSSQLNLILTVFLSSAKNTGKSCSPPFLRSLEIQLLFVFFYGMSTLRSKKNTFAGIGGHSLGWCNESVRKILCNPLPGSQMAKYLRIIWKDMMPGLLSSSLEFQFNSSGIYGVSLYQVFFSAL